MEEQTTLDKDENQLTAGLSLNGENYTGEKCFTPADAPIIIYYYALKISMENKSPKYIGKNYKDVVESLKEKGFTNIELKRANYLQIGFLKKRAILSP